MSDNGKCSAASEKYGPWLQVQTNHDTHFGYFLSRRWILYLATNVFRRERKKSPQSAPDINLFLA